MLQKKYPHLITELNGEGLYQGFGIANEKAKEFCAHALHNDLLIVPAGLTGIRLRPNLHISHGDVDKLFVRLESTCEGFLGTP